MIQIVFKFLSDWYIMIGIAVNLIAVFEQERKIYKAIRGIQQIQFQAELLTIIVRSLPLSNINTILENIRDTELTKIRSDLTNKEQKLVLKREEFLQKFALSISDEKNPGL